jgi:hypothetical protein
MNRFENRREREATNHETNETKETYEINKEKEI